MLPLTAEAGLCGSLLPAAWSFQLAARARGLGSAWTGLHLRETFRPAPRDPLDRVLHLDRW